MKINKQSVLKRMYFDESYKIETFSDHYSLKSMT